MCVAQNHTHTLSFCVKLKKPLKERCSLCQLLTQNNPHKQHTHTPPPKHQPNQQECSWLLLTQPSLKASCTNLTAILANARCCKLADLPIFQLQPSHINLQVFLTCPRCVPLVAKAKLHLAKWQPLNLSRWFDQSS